MNLSAGIAARGSSAAYLPISLISTWERWEGKQCRKTEEDIFFPPELLKKAGLLECKKGYDIKEKRDVWLLFENFSLSFHTDFLRHQWQCGVKELKEELQTGLAAAFGFPHRDGDGVPCRSSRLGMVTTFSFVLPGCSCFKDE